MQSLDHNDEYQAAIAEAANAFMRVMALRGFSVRDYPQNFVAHMARHSRMQFEANRQGAHPLADQWVSDFIRPVPNPALASKAKSSHKAKTIPFPVLGRRRAA